MKNEKIDCYEKFVPSHINLGWLMDKPWQIYASINFWGEIGAFEHCEVCQKNKWENVLNISKYRIPTFEF